MRDFFGNCRWSAIEKITYPVDTALVHGNAFVSEEPGLARQATAIAGECPVRSNDAVARHHNRDRVAAIGETYGTHGVPDSEPCRKLAIGYRRADLDPP